MKILQVHSFLYPHVGGSETYVLELSKRLKKRGHEVLIVTSLLSGDQRNEVIEGVDVLRLPGMYLPKVPYFLFTPELFRILLSLSKRFEILHSHVRFFFSTNCVALLRRIRQQSRFVLTLHSTHPQPQLTFLKCFEKFYEKTVGRFTVNNADCVIALDENVKQHVLSYGALEERIVTIPNGVDTEIFAPVCVQRTGRPLKNEEKMSTFTVGYVGNLVKRKGVKYLIQGIHKLVPKYNFQLRIVGDGPLKMELQALCSELSLSEFVSFEGALDKKLIPDFLRSVDVLVLPSLSEGMPTVVLEAMACGKAAIATDVGATRTVIDSPDVGILVPPQDPLAIKEALEKLITDEEKKIRMGKNARKKILSNYSWDAIVPRIEQVYLKVRI